MKREQLAPLPLPIIRTPDGLSGKCVTIRVSKSGKEFIAKALLEPMAFAGATPEAAVLGLMENHPHRFGLSFEDDLDNCTVVLGTTIIRDPQKAQVPQ